MVGLLFALITIPLIWYLLAFGYETILAFSRIKSGKFDRGAAFVHSTWEVTHTMLVYTFTVFAICFAGLLPLAANDLFWPIAVFMCALMTRGSLYLYLYFGSKDVKLSRFWHLVYALAHLASLLAVIVGAYRMVSLIGRIHFIPSTIAIGEVAIGFVLVAAISAIPLVQLYGRPKP